MDWVAILSTDFLPYIEYFHIPPKASSPSPVMVFSLPALINLSQVAQTFSYSRSDTTPNWIFYKQTAHSPPAVTVRLSKKVSQISTYIHKQARRPSGQALPADCRTPFGFAQNLYMT